MLCFFVASLESAFVVHAAQDSQGETIKCTYTAKKTWDHVGTQYTCVIDEYAIVDSPNQKFLQAPDPEVKVLVMGYNINVKYLPANTGDVFPNLIALFARNASIEAIYKKNFDGLQNLQYIHLGSNKIRKIANDTFRDLVSLRWLMLGMKKLL